MKRIKFSEDPFDQWRLSRVGGAIGFDRLGRAEFQFRTIEQYHEFLRLNEQREEFWKRRGAVHADEKAVRTQTHS